MAGTLFGLPLSQRVDLNGLPSVGWLLYLYTANTSTPVNSYQDTALSVLNPWPIAADSSGMMRQFWLADGSYRARATSADGSLTYFDQASILALGASSGAAPSGGVDPTAIFQTGDMVWLDRSGTRAGWVRDNGRTLGSGTSGASERANADCQPLFEFVWNTFSNAICPVIAGRGASSLADWTANKQITLPDHRGCVAMGADAMGNAASGRFFNVPVVTGAVDTVGSVVGENTHILTIGELAAHSHFASGNTDIQSAFHTHDYQKAIATGLTATAGGGVPLSTLTTVQTGVQIGDHVHGYVINTNNTGSSTEHNTAQRAIICTVYRKL